MQGGDAKVDFLDSCALATNNLDFARCLSDFKVLLLEAKRELLPNPSPWFPEISRLKFSLEKGQDLGVSGKVRTQVIYVSTLFQTDG